jgi:hypothetical protein
MKNMRRCWHVFSRPRFWMLVAGVQTIGPITGEDTVCDLMISTYYAFVKSFRIVVAIVKSRRR